MFNQLQATVGAQVANMIFKVGFVHPVRSHTVEGMATVNLGQPASNGVNQPQSSFQQKMQQESMRQQPQNNEHPDVGRNDPCWCGSGKKYKKCHGK